VSVSVSLARVRVMLMVNGSSLNARYWTVLPVALVAVPRWFGEAPCVGRSAERGDGRVNDGELIGLVGGGFGQGGCGEGEAVGRGFDDAETEWAHVFGVETGGFVWTTGTIPPESDCAAGRKNKEVAKFSIRQD
jgi:hypothetical protein